MRISVLYVELSAEDRARLDKVAAASGAAMGRPVRLAEVVRQLIRDAAQKTTPVRVRAETT